MKGVLFTAWLALLASPTWAQSLQDLERIAQQERLVTASGAPVSFRPDRGGLLLMMGCDGCRHTADQEAELQMILQRFADRGASVIVAPLPASSFPGETLFPEETSIKDAIEAFRPRPDSPHAGRLDPGPAFPLELGPESAQSLARAVRFSPQRHVMVYDPRGGQAFAGDLAGLVRFMGGR